MLNSVTASSGKEKDPFIVASKLAQPVMAELFLHVQSDPRAFLSPRGLIVKGTGFEITSRGNKRVVRDGSFVYQKRAEPEGLQPWIVQMSADPETRNIRKIAVIADGYSFSLSRDCVEIQDQLSVSGNETEVKRYYALDHETGNGNLTYARVKVTNSELGSVAREYWEPSMLSSCRSFDQGYWKVRESSPLDRLPKSFADENPFLQRMPVILRGYGGLVARVLSGVQFSDFCFEAEKYLKSVPSGLLGIDQMRIGVGRL